MLLVAFNILNKESNDWADRILHAQGKSEIHILDPKT